MKLHLLQILLQQESLLMLHSFFLYVQEPPLLTDRTTQQKTLTDGDRNGHYFDFFFLSLWPHDGLLLTE